MVTRAGMYSFVALRSRVDRSTRRDRDCTSPHDLVPKSKSRRRVSLWSSLLRFTKTKSGGSGAQSLSNAASTSQSIINISPSRFPSTSVNSRNDESLGRNGSRSPAKPVTVQDISAPKALAGSKRRRETTLTSGSARNRTVSEAHQPPTKRRVWSASVKPLPCLPMSLAPGNLEPQAPLSASTIIPPQNAASVLSIYTLPRGPVDGQRAPGPALARRRTPLSLSTFEHIVTSSSSERTTAPNGFPTSRRRALSFSRPPVSLSGGPKPPSKAEHASVCRVQKTMCRSSVMSDNQTNDRARPPLIRRRSPLAPPNSNPAVVLPQKDVVGRPLTYPFAKPPRSRKGSTTKSIRAHGEDRLALRVFQRHSLMNASSL
ncbi:hypothetical protein BKA70DRAFT_1416031 [Coprinopsis sp. MPI-PUGE-AT-0042]|nr:hypothetical protein BKA70DRAFT_1416031 [Coprinopsis sp. MPI-PUGE-AT-0042]